MDLKFFYPPLVSPSLWNSSDLSVPLVSASPGFISTAFAFESGFLAPSFPSFSSSQPHLYNSAIVEQSKIFYYKHERSDRNFREAPYLMIRLLCCGCDSPIVRLLLLKMSEVDWQLRIPGNAQH
jgi:hypothetical protein